MNNVLFDIEVINLIEGDFNDIANMAFWLTRQQTDCFCAILLDNKIKFHWSLRCAAAVHFPLIFLVFRHHLRDSAVAVLTEMQKGKNSCSMQLCKCTDFAD